MSPSVAKCPHSPAVAWHDCECGGYDADLALWRELAAQAGGRVLELGAGTGRVALDLARAGFDVTAVDRDPELLTELQRRARAHGTEVAVVHADVRHLELTEHHALIVAPMQLVHLLGGDARRGAMLRSAAAHLAPGGILAAALLADPEQVASDDERPPLPDVVERDGWVYSSLPLDVRRLEGALEVRRLRQVVSPGGDLDEEIDITRLELLDPNQLESEALAAGLRRAGRREIPATGDHVGSTVVLLEVA
jgi:SAM-dependent methyltransferase